MFFSKNSNIRNINLFQLNSR